MRIRLVYGRAGSGKTRRCLESVALALRAEGPEGPPLILLTPEQATFQMERALLEWTGGRAFTRARALSFRRLAHWVFAENGGPETPAITPLQRRLLLRHLLRRLAPALQVFRRAALQPGFEDEAARILEEFLRQKVEAEGLRAIAAALESGEEEAGAGGEGARRYLAAKARDLAALLEAYLRAAEGRFYQPEEIPQLLAQSLARRPLLGGARVWVDGFASFTPQEFEALGEVLRQAAETELLLCLDPAAARGATGGGAAAAADAREIFAETLRTRDRLLGLAARIGAPPPGEIALEPPRGMGRFHAAPALARLEREWGRQRPATPPADGADKEKAAESLRLIEAPTPRAQARAVARELRRLREEQGLAWREMAVITRDVEACRADLEPALKEFGIPYYLDTRRSLNTNPLVNALRAAARVALRGWRTPDVIEFLKSGFAAAPAGHADRLENYTLEHGLNGRAAWTAAADWTAWPARRLDEEQAPADDPDGPARRALEEINAWRREATQTLIEWEAANFPRGGAGSETPPAIRAGALARAFADLLRRMSAAEKMEALERQARREGDLGAAQEFRQTLPAALEALRDVALAFGEEELAFAEALDLIETALRDLRVGALPLGLDEVMISAVDRSRHPEIRAALVPGLVEGEFPRAHSQDPLLNDTERETLRQRGVEVAPPARARLLNESYLAYIAFTRPSQWLWVCAPATDAAGEFLAPSPYWRRLRAIFPELAVERVNPEGCPAKEPEPEGADWMAAAATARRWAGAWARRWREALAAEDARGRAALERLLGEARTLARENPAADGAGDCAATRAVTGRACLRRALDHLLPALEDRNEAALSPALARALFAPEGVARLSLSQAELFTSCPFRHFAAYGLGLAERPEYRLEAVDLGSLYHAALSRWMGRLLREGARIEALEAEQIREGLAREAEAIAPKLKNRILLSSARFEYLLGILKRTLGGAGEAIVAGLRRGAFRPRAVEVAFGSRGAALPGLELDLGGGRRLRLRGRIDRLDTTRAAPGRGPGVRVVDYKTSSRTLDLPRVFHGLELQLVGYLLAVTRSPGAAEVFGGPPAPAGAFYLPILENSPRYDSPADVEAETDEERFARRAMRGVFDAAWLDALEPVEPGGRAVFHRVWRKKEGALSEARSDALDSETFALLLARVERILAEVGRGLFAGRVEIAPASYAGATPCDSGYCPFAAVCRVDPRTNPPRVFPKFPRAGLAARLRESLE